MTTPTTILRRRLRRTWSPFFAHHGNLTAVQQHAIPHLLNGRNTLVIAATAAGKTEAAVAPLVERLFHGGRPRKNELAILYICPTRALTRDLYERLRRPLDELHIALAMKTGDTAPISAKTPPTVLLTTPESTDSMLTRSPRLFIHLRALVIDEVHLFDGTPRGDHLRCLLRRIEYIRAYHQQTSGQPAAPLQRVALSATVDDPAGVAQRYLQDDAAPDQPAETMDYEIVSVPGRRELEAELVDMAGLHDLAMHITRRAGAPLAVRKALLFCNTRGEVEQTAAFLRSHLPFDVSVFVHYSNLDAKLRRDVERDFAAASVAICVCTSTLELGIDIGSIDDVVLMGPPPTLSSFLQRIGRGGRRTQTTRLLCLARSPLEEVRFRALLHMAEATDADLMGFGKPVRSSGMDLAERYRFRPSVLVQQIFSLLKQSPTGAVRLPDLRRITPTDAGLDDEHLRAICSNLVGEKYLQGGRIGEWRPGPALDELLDAHEIYSNIGSDPLRLIIVDAFSGRTIAQTDRARLEGDALLLGGRSMEVVWRDGYRIGVRAGSQAEMEDILQITATPFAVPLDVSQGVAAYLGLAPGQLCILQEAGESWLFHFWGELYGALLADMLQQAHYPDASARRWRGAEGGEIDDDDADELIQVRNEYCIRLPEPILALPPWDARLARQALNRLLPRFEPTLNLGRFHNLLPPAAGHAVAVSLCNMPRLRALYEVAQIVAPAGDMQSVLRRLI
ncbi:MAG: DEAD/DEAH box helicase [Caldilineaceae bacterium]